MAFTFRFSITLVLLFISLTVPSWADLPEGLEAYQRGDYATAVRELRPLAAPKRKRYTPTQNSGVSGSSVEHVSTIR